MAFPRVSHTGRSAYFTRQLAIGIMGGAVSAAMLVGCDRSASQADDRVDQAVAEALPLINGTEQNRAQAATLLGTASGEADASIESRIFAKEILAQSELRAAEALEPKIESTQSQINRLAWEIGQLAGQIQSSNQVATALSKYEPTPVQNALKQNIADVQGSAQKPEWVKTDSGAVMSLAVVTKDQADLQSRIDDLTKTIKGLADQRTQLLAKSDDLMQQSTSAKGDKAVDLFKQAADARKQADELVVQIDQNNVQLTRAQQDLAVKNGQQEALNGAIAIFNKNSQDVAATWQTLQQQIEEQRKQAKDLLGDESNPAPADDAKRPPSIADRGLKIDELNKANRATREEAETHLNNAISKFGEAATLATQLQSDLMQKIREPKNLTRPDKDAWQAQATSMHPARFQLQQANAESHRARLFAGRAAEASIRQQLAASLKPILDPAKLALPASFQDTDSKIADDLKNGREQATAAYTSADELLGKVADSTATDLQPSAHIARLFTNYGWHLFAAANGDKDTADKARSAAEAERDAITSSGTVIRNLPAELVVAPTTAPTTPPGETPAVPGAAPAAPTTPAAPQG